MDIPLVENSLCISLHSSQIIPGTCIFYADSFLFIYCPTQTALHRFFLHIPVGFAMSVCFCSIPRANFQLFRSIFEVFCVLGKVFTKSTS